MAESAEQALDEQAATLQQLVGLISSLALLLHVLNMQMYTAAQIRISTVDDLMLADRVSSLPATDA